jgi:hypothetical protein
VPQLSDTTIRDQVDTGPAISALTFASVMAGMGIAMVSIVTAGPARLK